MMMIHRITPRIQTRPVAAAYGRGTTCFASRTYIFSVLLSPPWLISLFYLLVAVHYCSSLAVSFIYFVVCFIAYGSLSNLPTVTLPFFSSSRICFPEIIGVSIRSRKKTKAKPSGIYRQKHLDLSRFSYLM